MEGAEEKLSLARQQMVRKQLASRGIRRPELLKAFSEVPREQFLPSRRRHEAYEDHPVPIGHDQTISQPYVVALMLQELDPQPHHRVLDVGAGSGYQTALLSRLVAHVYAIERIEQLTEQAMGVLAGMNVSNVTICTGDGTLGWPEEAPFDRIICGAGAPDVPQAWIEQLIEGGRIVLPVGDSESQTIVVVAKQGDKTIRREICDVRFVKLIGEDGWAPP